MKRSGGKRKRSAPEEEGPVGRPKRVKMYVFCPSMRRFLSNRIAFRAAPEPEDKEEGHAKGKKATLKKGVTNKPPSGEPDSASRTPRRATRANAVVEKGGHVLRSRGKKLGNK